MGVKRQGLRTRTLVILAGLPVCSAGAATDKDAWDVTGVLDTYYQFDFAYPHTHTLLAGRADDAVRDHFEFANAQLNIMKKPVAKAPWGLTLSLTSGRDADLVSITDPAGSSRYETLLQAYVSYLCSGRTPVTIDLGKFLRPPRGGFLVWQRHTEVCTAQTSPECGGTPDRLSDGDMGARRPSVGRVP